MPLVDEPSTPDNFRLESINSSELDGVSDVPDIPTSLEKREIEIEHLRAQVDNFKQEMEARKKYAKNIFFLTCVWISAIYVLLMLQGFGRYREYTFHLSDSVVLASIGSTTANIVGVFLIVTRYFFPKKKP